MSSINTTTKYANDVAIVWIDLSFSGSRLIGPKSKIILNGLSGYLEFGSLVALMGPSGCGKSTFLKCINGQNSAGLSPDTEIYLNKSKKIRPCFITQDVSDHLLSGLSVNQALIYASKLKNSGENYRVDHQSNVKLLMDELLIGDTADTRISRCSGGEQKRIAIAAELTAIKMPNLLCIDEPTSGLDSNSAEIVIECLKNVALKHHIAIVTSIHQPNAEILLLYDQIYVLSRGGKFAYSGSPQDIGVHLKLCSIQLGAHHVPVEVLINVAARGTKNSTVKEMIARTYDHNKSAINRYQSECSLAANGILRARKSFRFINFWYLLIRTLINTVRQRWFEILIHILVVPAIIEVIVVLGDPELGQTDGCVRTIGANDSNHTDSCLARAEQLEQEGLINQNIGFIFVLVILIEFLEVVLCVQSFASEIKIFLNEHLNGWYSTSCYYWAKSLVELPIPALVTSLYVYFGYAGSHQIDSDQFRLAGTLCFAIAGVVCCQGISFIMAVLFDRNQSMAVTCTVMQFLVYVLLCDMVTPIKELHPLLRTLSDGSFVKQVFHSCIVYIYGFDRCGDGSVSWALQQFDLHVDESRKLALNYVLLGTHLVVFRLVGLFVLIRKADMRQRES